MNELDSYMAEYAEKFKCGNRRKINPAFKKKLDVCRGKEERLKRNLSKMSEEEKEGLIAEIRELRCNLKSIPYSDPMDDSYKRIQCPGKKHSLHTDMILQSFWDTRSQSPKASTTKRPKPELPDE